MGTANPDVDAYVREDPAWREEIERLREILVATELTEELKWRQPCYTFDAGNVALIFRMKERCAVGFLKGALLEDPDGVLVAPGENSQAMRYLEFTSVDDVVAKESVLRDFVGKAIGAEKAGLSIKFKDTSEFEVPEELRIEFDESPELKAAFDALTPGRQRGYLLYFSGAKQSKTRASRIEKHRQRILEGKGIHDQH